MRKCYFDLDLVVRRCGRCQTLLTDVADIVAAGRADHPLPGLTDAPDQTVLLQAVVGRLQPDPGGDRPGRALCPDPVSLPGDVIAARPELAPPPPRNIVMDQD